MKPLAMVLALSTLSLGLQGCKTAHTATALRPDTEHPERFVCAPVAPSERPQIPPEYVIDWAGVVTVDQARVEHDAFVRSVRARERVAALHIVEIENRVFACASNMQWIRDFFAGLGR